MKGFLTELSGLGVSIAEFVRISNISFPSLKKIDAGLPVRAVTHAKALRAFQAIKAELAKSGSAVFAKRSVR